MGVPLRIEITLNSKVELTNLIHAASDEVCRLVGLDEDAMFNLGLALREAAVNAMKHGNKLRENVPIRIVFSRNGDKLEVAIADQGEGFDFQNNVDPRLPENLDKTSGRGIFLMRNFVDDVRFRSEPGKGTTVRLIKKLPRSKAAAKPRAARRG